MKIKTSLLAVAISFTIAAVNAQAPTLHDPNLTPTITDKEIIELGQTHQENRSVIVLDFEGLGNVQQILDYYDGGFAGGGFGPGPDYGVTFSGSTLSIIAGYAGGNGNFQNEPSPSTVMFFLDENNAIMNVAAGFSTGFSFYYSSTTFSGSVEVYDEVGGAGNLLASLNLPALGSLPIPGGIYNIWAPVGVAFNGVAKSVKFIGAANYIGFDDVTFGSDTPGGPQVPVSPWALYIGIFMIVAFTVIRFRRMI